MRNMFFLLVLFLPSFVSATAQIPDKIYVDGKLKDLFSEPLSVYLKSNNIELPNSGESNFQVCSAAWRGYQAHWEIRNEKLYLTAIYDNPCDKNPSEVPLSLIFDNAKKRIHATWYSGPISIPIGERTQYVHMGYQSKYEQYLVIIIEKGNVKSKKTIDSNP